MGALVLLFLGGCSSASIPTLLKGQKDDKSPNLSEGESEGADSGKGLDEPVPVAGAFLVCSEDQSLLADALKNEIGCRLEDEKGERIEFDKESITAKFTLVLPGGLEVEHELVPAASRSFWDWHIFTALDLLFPEQARLVLSEGKRSTSYETKISRQALVTSVYRNFQLGDNALNTGLAVDARDCTAVTNLVIEDRHGLELGVTFTVKAIATRVRIALKGVCGVEQTTDLRLFNAASNTELSKVTSTDGDSALVYDLPAGQYRFVVKPTYKTPTDADDFAVGDISLQALKAGDLEGIAASVSK